MQGRNGFTLVELMVTIAVGVILITLAAPAFQSIIDNNRRAAQVNEFVTSITYARSEALKRGNNVGLCRAEDYQADTPTCGKGAGWEDGWVVFDDEDDDQQPSSGEVLDRHPPLSGGETTLRGNAKVDKGIFFAGNGRIANGTMGTLTWCDKRGPGKHAREIAFPLSGRIRVGKGHGASKCKPKNK